LDEAATDAGIAASGFVFADLFFGYAVCDEDDDIGSVTSGAEGLSAATGLTGNMFVEFCWAADKLNSVDATWPLGIINGGGIDSGMESFIAG
jgi:hypothetical protein